MHRTPHVRQPTRVLGIEDCLLDVDNKIHGFDLPHNGSRFNGLVLDFPETKNW
jgi:hypothetical protein